MNPSRFVVYSVLVVLLSAVYAFLRAKNSNVTTGHRKTAKHDNVNLGNPGNRDTANSSVGESRFRDHGGWKVDPYMEELSRHVGCDIPILDARVENFEAEEQRLSKAGHPYILRGKMDEWRARDSWKREALIQLYGDRKIGMGSQTAIVWNLGVAPISLPLREYVTGMRTVFDLHVNNTAGASSRSSASSEASLSTPTSTDPKELRQQLFSEESISFDVEVIGAIPELVRDFNIPREFSSWHFVPDKVYGGYNRAKSEEAKRRGVPSTSIEDVTTALSLAPSRSGLLFHTHGRAWLGLVYGKKWWFLYPPEATVPEKHLKEHNMLKSTLDWYLHEYPKLSAFPKPPSTGFSQGAKVNANGYRPLECVQQPDDIMVVPNLWTHQTLNIGEAIGVGGQMDLLPVDKLRLSTAALAPNKRNNEILKHYALAHHSFYGMYKAGQLQGMREGTAEEHLQAALDAYLLIVDMTPNNIGGWFLLMDLYITMQKWNEIGDMALSAERAVDRLRGPGVSPSALCSMYALICLKMRLNFGELEGKSGVRRYARSKQLIDKALGVHPYCLPALIEEANWNMHFDGGSLTGFIAAMNKVLAISPDYPNGQLLLKGGPDFFRRKEEEKR